MGYESQRSLRKTHAQGNSNSLTSSSPTNRTDFWLIVDHELRTVRLYRSFYLPDTIQPFAELDLFLFGVTTTLQEIAISSAPIMSRYAQREQDVCYVDLSLPTDMATYKY